MKPRTIVLDDGFRVGYLTGGIGYPLVFLHGLGVSASAYEELLNLLVVSGFNVYGFDAPDHGRTDSLPWGHSLADMAKVLVKALDTIGVDKFVLVGHSMGGAIAAEVAATIPDRVLTAVLLDAAVGEAHHKSIEVTASPNFPLKAARLLSGAVLDIAGDAIKAGSVRRLQERLDLFTRLRGSVSGPGALKAVWALVNHDSAPALLEMEDQLVRTFVVHGSEDRIVPPMAAYHAAGLAGAKLQMLPGQFHSWMVSTPMLAVSVITKAVWG